MPPGVVAIVGVAVLTVATVSVIQAFQSPKPSRISFGTVGGDQGPRYGTFGPLDNTISNEIAIPILYGQLQLYGNLIWQTDPGTTVSRIIGLCEGQISSITDVRANNNVISDTNTPGSTYTTYLGTGTQGADSRVPASLRPDMEMHNLAYIALTLTVGEVIKGGNPTITSVCQGLLVETWDGTKWLTTKVYSRNSAACVRDFLLSVRYGLGKTKADLDEASFGEIYDYCEGLVDVPTGGQEARYRIDYVMDNQRPAEDFLNDMLATFAGSLVYGKKIKLRCEKIEPITQYFGDGSTTKANATFDPNNILKDSMSWNFPSIDDRPNRIRLQWVDPAQNYTKVYAQIDDRIDQDDRNIVNQKDVALLGITRATQALRMAKMYMTKAKYGAANVQFSARLESIHCEVGDIVAITHQSAKFSRRLFRISDMQLAEDETIRIICAEYNPAFYDDHQAAAVLTVQQPSGPNLYAPLADVTILTLLEDNYKNKDGVFVTNILASWTAIPADQLLRLDRHLIQLSTDGGTTYRDVAFASAQKTSYRIVLGNVQTGTTFTVRVKTVSDRGAESPGTTGSITIQGKRTPPSNVSNFTATFAYDHIAFTWSAVDDEDLFAYEIRVGPSSSSWETATIVATEILTTRYDLLNFTTGTKKYYIKAIDNSQNYSETAAVSSVVVTSIPERNVVFTFDLWQYVSELVHPLEGTLSSGLDRLVVSNYDPTYNRLAFGPKTVNKWSDFQSQYATWQAFQASGFIWGRETYISTEETYVTTPVDIGTITTGSFNLELYGFSSSNLGFLSVDIATSNDNITWSSFSAFVPGQYTARYVKFQFRIQAIAPPIGDNTTSVRLSGAYLTVDVPDVNQTLLNQAISAGGATIYLTGFTKVKSVVMTTVGTTNLTPRINDQSNLPNSFDVRMFDVDGVATAGSVNIYIRGY